MFEEAKNVAFDCGVAYGILGALRNSQQVEALVQEQTVDEKVQEIDDTMDALMKTVEEMPSIAVFPERLKTIKQLMDKVEKLVNYFCKD